MRQYVAIVGWCLMVSLAAATTGGAVLQAEEGVESVPAVETPAVETPAAEPQAPVADASVPVVGENMQVTLNYTLTVDGNMVETTEGKEPLTYVHGRRQLIVGFEQGLNGLHVGDATELSIPPEQGYGTIDPSAVVEVQKNQLPTDVAPEVGTVLRGVNPDGQSFRAKITEVKADTVVLDLNHPLAGKTLNFKIKVLDIKPIPH
jgi:FKBP-type peptidyl-prolyl cis-trans isomerase SlyD